MSFFDELPEPEPYEERRYVDPEWRRVPLEVVPTVMPISAVLHRTPHAALVLGGVNVYPNGITFTLTAVRHPEVEPGDGPMHGSLHGGSGGATEAARVGVLHADGTKAAYPTGPDAQPEDPNDPPAAFVVTRGGSGSTDYATGEYWAWPLPATGDLTLVFRWSAGDLDETRHVLPGDALREAAEAATEIWPGAKMPEPTTGGGSSWSDY